ncbi:hypothetical protein [Cetobacterium sp.]|uniref:hypothetical protein n=1 Tax=Cetobacterium sp. TaxID=2071632 RepID=UPI003F34D837
MKKYSFFKIALLSFTLLLLSSCSAIMTSIGNSKIDNALKIYYSRGLTSEGTSDLISGLDYVPDSGVGIAQYQKQYAEITSQKNRVLQNRYFSTQDINSLNLYLLTVEEFRKIHSKFPTVKIDYNDFNSSKLKITKIFEDFVLKDEKIYIPRNQKIQNINYYKILNKYVNSYIINSAITDLERDVTINLYVSSSFRGFSRLDYLVTNSLVYASDMNRNRNLGDYVIFKGFSNSIMPTSKDYFIDFNFSNVYIRTLETREEVKDKNKIFVARKRVTISGFYKVYSPNKKTTTKYFDFSENYTIRVRSYDHSTFYDDERDIIKDILEDKFSNIIRYDLNTFINP